MPPKKKDSRPRQIIVKGAREHNLKNINLEIPRNKLVVFTGVSGSGKSSLVFDTIYAEGQRRYVESLSSYARQFLERMNKPDVDLITGISPAVAIEQKTTTRNSRSTVGTSTEIYDYLRLLFARIGRTYCFKCGKEVLKASTSTVCDFLETLNEGDKYYLTFPIHEHEGRSVDEEINSLSKRGFFRFWHKGNYIDLNDGEFHPKVKKGVRVVVDRFRISKGKMRDKLADSIETTFKEGENRLSVINADTGEEKELNKFYECCGIRYEEPEPRLFSFNNPFGACPECQGFSKTIGLDMNLVIPNDYTTLADGAIAPFRTDKFNINQMKLIQESRKHNVPVDIPYRELTQEQKDKVFNGFGSYKGIKKFFDELGEKTYKMHIRILLSRYRGYTTCSVCGGARLRKEALQVKVNGKNIAEIVVMPIEKTLEFFSGLQLTEYEQKVAERLLKELLRRLRYLDDVGLGYLTLDRISSTLSGGESQRINLATALGSSLVGTLYVLDEPSIGLHPADNEKLINILRNLRDIGNSVLVVEHDPEMMRAADILIDMGPAAGTGGGSIVAQGSYQDYLKKEFSHSLTAQYLSGKKKISLPALRRENKTSTITIEGAREHNLRNIDVTFPLNKFVAVTGVSGSGKSTLIHKILYAGIAAEKGLQVEDASKYTKIIGINHIQHIEVVDQSPIGKSPRSNPISYIKAFDVIRDLFAHTHLAKTRQYTPGYFSFNVPGGRCDVCEGDGFIKVEMQFLADIYLECDNCHGTRYKKETLEVTYAGKNIVEVLDMTVDEALVFFDGIKKLTRLLKVLSDVGLGYIKLGQPSNTLSGGEAQRIKLANHLTASDEGTHTLFIFDEPTTGLHYDDISKLLKCFDMLIEKGNSVFVIEHNLEVIKCADYIIDLGPGAGDKGGEVVATGTPEEIIKNGKSVTGKFLKEVIY